MENQKKFEYRYEVINYLIQKYDYQTYLELGVQSGYNFKKINCKKKISVDPDNSLHPEMTYALPSDDYFAQYSEPIDIAFLDGLHHADQLERDILNTLDRLTEGGIIVCHDCSPQSKESATVPRIQQIWNGDVYKTICKLRSERDDLEIFTINCDEGLGIIRKADKKVEKLDLKGLEINYDNFDANRSEWLNLVDPIKAYELL